MAMLPFILPWHGVYGGITPAKEDIIFIVDNSSAMRQGDRQFALPDSIRAFVGHISHDVRTALILFHESVTLKVPFVSVNNEQVNEFVQGLESIDYSDRFSNSAAAVERALYELQDSGRKGAGKSIILFTHGHIDTGREVLDRNFTKWLSSVLAEDAAIARIRIFCVAFGAPGETQVLENIARRTSGTFYRYTGESEMSSIFDNLAIDIFFKPLGVSVEEPSAAKNGAQ